MKRRIITSAMAVLFTVFLLSSCQKHVTMPDSAGSGNGVALGANQSLAIGVFQAIPSMRSIPATRTNG